MTTENNVAAQAGDEPMRAAFEKIDKVSRWIDKFPVPTTGATAMMCLLRDAKELLTATPRATADVERDAEIAKFVWQLISDGVLDHVLTGSDESGHEESFGSDTEEMAYLIASIKSARTRIATTKPGA